MKIVKKILMLILVVLIGFYIYYSSMSMKIYKQLDYYRAAQNNTAEMLTRQIIEEKYPGSIAHLKIKSDK